MTNQSSCLTYSTRNMETIQHLENQTKILYSKSFQKNSTKTKNILDTIGYEVMKEPLYYGTGEWGKG